MRKGTIKIVEAEAECDVVLLSDSSQISRVIYKKAVKSY
jgi:hypothetical protein